MVKIFIDPGHGGAVSGAIGNGLQEKNVTLAIAIRIRDMLLSEFDGVSVQMSRTGDQTLPLEERTKAANSWGADYFLSIHINAGGGTGFEDYIYTNPNSKTADLRTSLHSEIIKLVDFQDRGKKMANFHVLRESNMAACLTENGFIDHPSDAAKLQSNSFINSLVRGHVNGLAKAFNLKKQQYHKVIKGDTVYSISKEYGSTIAQIKSWNNLDTQYTIRIGQNLRVK
jgi:N-acetylmuramoyl-L-alanine amidase